MSTTTTTTASASAPASAVDARSASGLVVFTSTSDTPLVSFNTDEMRLRRMRRRIVKAATVHREANNGLEPAMVTLTYAGMDDWSPRHISEALKRVRGWMGRRGFRLRYCWTAELQERGAIHYHILAWLPRGRGQMAPFWDVQGWWPHGHSQSAWATNPVGYMVKYISKINGKHRLPGGARMHGSGGFTVAERQSMSYDAKPGWVRKLAYIGQRITRPKGGGIVQHFACGLSRRIASPWMLVARGLRHIVIARKDAGLPSIRTALEAYPWPTTPTLTLA